MRSTTMQAARLALSFFRLRPMASTLSPALPRPIIPIVAPVREMLLRAAAPKSAENT